VSGNRIPLRRATDRFGAPELPPSRTADGKVIPLPNSHQIPLATFATWSVNIPRQYSIDDLLDLALWRTVEIALQARTGRPKPGDLIRCIAEDGSYDAFLVIQEVNRGYRLIYSHGRLPEASTP
jgi:hypothetical protein